MVGELFFKMMGAQVAACMKIWESVKTKYLFTLYTIKVLSPFNPHDLCEYQTGCDKRVELLPNIGARWLGRLTTNFQNNCSKFCVDR